MCYSQLEHTVIKVDHENMHDYTEQSLRGDFRNNNETKQRLTMLVVICTPPYTHLVHGDCFRRVTQPPVMERYVVHPFAQLPAPVLPQLCSTSDAKSVFLVTSHSSRDPPSKSTNNACLCRLRSQFPCSSLRFLTLQLLCYFDSHLEHTHCGICTCKVEFSVIKFFSHPVIQITYPNQH